MLRAELFLVQRDAAAVRAQLEVLRRQQECRSGNGGGSGATTPRGLASVRPSASSTPVKSPPAAIPEAHVASPSVSVSRMPSPADEQIAQLKVRPIHLCHNLPSAGRRSGLNTTGPMSEGRTAPSAIRTQPP